VCLSGCARQGVRDEPTMRRLLAAFAPDRLRVELQRPFQRHDRTLNRGLASLASRLGVACVATGNVHAHARSRAPLQDAFVALRHHTTLDASEPLRRGNFAHVLAAPAAMAARFEDHPEAVAETLELVDRLRFDLGSDLGYRYPGSEDADAGRKLAELCWAKMDERYPPGHPCHADAHARLQEELRVIEALGLPGFFILHRDLLELAREVAVEVRGPDTARALLPPGRGRGSSVSSIVCYLTGLSHIDPVENQLFLGRFLNEELTSLPDIDLDFPRDVREVLIPRIHDRYGAERSALVAAFPTFRSRGAIRELGKVLGLPPGELERAARGAEPFAVHGVTRDVESALGLEPGGPPPPIYDPDSRGDAGAPFAMTTHEWLAAVNGRDPAKESERRAGAEARYAALPGRWEWLARLCDEAYGLPRHLSQHSGCCRRSSAAWSRSRARAASAWTSRGSRSTTPTPTRRSRRPTRWASSRSRAARRCSRCTARARSRSTTSRSRSRSCARARSSAARSTRTSRACRSCARTRTSSCPTSIRRWSPCWATRSARSSSRTR
jgi:error-prone DNA polymerase